MRYARRGLTMIWPRGYPGDRDDRAERELLPRTGRLLGPKKGRIGGSGPLQGFEQRASTQKVHHPLHIVGQHLQTHFGAHFR